MQYYLTMDWLLMWTYLIILTLQNLCISSHVHVHVCFVLFCVLFCWLYTMSGPPFIPALCWRGNLNNNTIPILYTRDLDSTRARSHNLYTRDQDSIRALTHNLYTRDQHSTKRSHTRDQHSTKIAHTQLTQETWIPLERSHTTYTRDQHSTRALSHNLHKRPALH